MFIPVAKVQFTTAQSGQALKAVVCEKCQTEYFYILQREGVGHGTAMYGIGKGSAAKLSEAAAQQQLQKKLEQEAELVPCPKCHWVSREMVQALRRQQYSGFKYLMIGAVVAGILLAGIVALDAYEEVSFAKQREGYFHAILCIAGGLAMAGLLVGAKWLMQQQYNPNACYPQETPGMVPSAEALMVKMDEQTGQAKLVTTEGQEIELENKSSTVQEHGLDTI